NSGKIYVFAHLSKFRSDIEKYVIKKQFKAFQYTQSLYFNHKFFVTKNEVIGYSGATGLKSPHLHFEVRNESNNPINPMGLLSIVDTLPPKIDSIELIPLNRNSFISGLSIPIIVHENDTLGLNGQFGIIAYCKDFIDDKNYTTVPYVIKTNINGTKRVVFTANHFFYNKNHTAAWFFVINNTENGIRLYNNPQNPNINTPKNMHLTVVSITARDFSGNVDRFSFFIEAKGEDRESFLSESDTLFRNGVIQIVSRNKNIYYKNAILLKRIRNQRKYYSLFYSTSDTFFIDSDTFYRFSGRYSSLNMGNLSIKLRRNALREYVIAAITFKDDTLNLKFSDTPFEFPLVITNKKYKKKMIFVNTLNGNYLGTKKAYISRSIHISTKLDTSPPFVAAANKIADTIFVSAGDADSRIVYSSATAYYNGKRLLAIPTVKGFKFIAKETLPNKGLFIFQCKDKVGNKLLYKKRFNR
ncbi:MAG: hypothetical protein GWP03_06615, partial [Proteobacteria bacterium]|nr:hypothetical protein [Pseudomonadota bacterium]